MEINYLKSMIKNPLLDDWTNKGLKIDEIESIENNYNHGNVFPKSIREFLYLAGRSNNIAFDTHDSIERLQERAREVIKKCEQKLDRPFFAFDQLDNCEQFTIVFLDEDHNDPDVYLCEPFDAKERNYLYRRYKDYTFSSLVEEHIYRIKNNYPLD